MLTDQRLAQIHNTATRIENDLTLSDNTVSRFHCEIRLIGDAYLLVDHASTNGTYIGPLRVVEVFLYPDVELLIGSTA